MAELRPLLPKRPFWTTGQVAAKLGVSPRTVERYCDDGTIAATRTPGGHRRIAREVVEALLASAA